MAKNTIKTINDSNEFALCVSNLIKESTESALLDRNFSARRCNGEELFSTSFTVSKKPSIVEENPKSTNIHTHIDFATLLELTANVYRELSVGADMDSVIHNFSDTGISVDFQTFGEGKIFIFTLNREEAAIMSETLESIRKELVGRSH